MSFSGETAQDTEYKSNCNFEGDKCAVLPVMNKSAHLHTETFKQFVYSLMDHPPSLNGFDKQKHCYNQWNICHKHEFSLLMNLYYKDF